MNTNSLQAVAKPLQGPELMTPSFSGRIQAHTGLSELNGFAYQDCIRLSQQHDDCFGLLAS